nr:TIGR03943 family protein [uncultured Peptostreptococcus sp.]
MFNKLNFQVLIELLIELFAAVALAVNLYTGRINSFVHPKFNLILIFSVVVLLVMAGISSMSLFRPRHMNMLARYFVIFIPIMVMFYINTDSFSSIGDTGSSDQVLSGPPPSQNLQVVKETVYKREAGKSYIDIDDDMYLKWYYDCTFAWDRYKDDQFKFLARVFKDPSQKNQFVVLGRMGMICCMADMQPCGFIYNGKGYDKLKDGQWYYVTGSIAENKKYTYNYEQLPQVTNISLKEARRPTDEYVYIK